MKSRSKKLIGPFILLAISLAMFTILLIALAPELNQEGEASPTETMVQTRTAAISTATAIPSATPPRDPTFTAESIPPTGTPSIQATVAPSKTPEAVSKLQSKKIEEQPSRGDKPTPCPPWKFWCKWIQ